MKILLIIYLLNIQWIWSYLTYRSQEVYVEVSLSSLVPLEAGVPQGSILGPVSYTMFLEAVLVFITNFDFVPPAYHLSIKAR